MTLLPHIRLFALCILGCTLWGGACAQSPRWLVGGRLGATVSNYADDEGLFSTLAGGHGCVAVSWRAVSWFGLQAEATLQMRGGRNLYLLKDERTWWGQLPILPTFYFLQGRIQPKFYTGIAPALYLAGPYDNIRRYDLGICGG